MASDSHQIGTVSMNDGAERQPALPRWRHVGDADVTVSVTLSLTPLLQSSHLGSHLQLLTCTVHHSLRRHGTECKQL